MPCFEASRVRLSFLTLRGREVPKARRSAGAGPLQFPQLHADSDAFDRLLTRRPKGRKLLAPSESPCRTRTLAKRCQFTTSGIGVRESLRREFGTGRFMRIVFAQAVGTANVCETIPGGVF